MRALSTWFPSAFAVVTAGVPNASATILQGMLLVFYLACSLLFSHRAVWRRRRTA